MQEDRRIIFEVGEELGLTREQALDLWDQYWCEYVLRNLIKMEYVSVVVLELGSFFAKERKLESKGNSILKKYENHANPKMKSAKMKEAEKLLNYANLIKERNKKFKRKRIYG